jgi:WD40 repeat protein
MKSGFGLAVCVFLAIAGSEARSQPPLPKTDVDAPPQGATLRLGTNRLRDFIYVSSFAVSADGKTIAIPDAGGIRVCEVATGKKLLLLPCPIRFGDSIAISDDGRVLAAVHVAGISTWELETGKLLATREERQAGHSMFVSADGKRIAALGGVVLPPPGGSNSGRPTRFTAPFVWDAADNKELLRGPEPKSTFNGKLALSADGKSIAFLMSSTPVPLPSEKSKLEVWDVESAKPRRILTSMTAATGIALSPDGKRLAVCTSPAGIEIWNVENGLLETRLAGRRAALLHAAFSADGKQFAAILNIGQVVAWDLTKDAPPVRLHDRLLDHALGVRFAADDTLIAWGIEGVSPVVWEPETGKVRNTTLGHCAPVTALQFSSDGKRLTSASADAEVIAWNVATGRVERRARLKPEGDDRGIPTINAALSLSTNGQYAVLNGTFNGIHLFDLRENQHLLSFQPPNSSVRLPVALSPDCMHLACGDLEGGITVWSTRSGRSEFGIAEPGRTIVRAAFSPDGKHLALIDKSTKNPSGREQPANVRLFAMPSGKLIAELAEIETPYSPPALTFSPNGSMLAVANMKTIEVLQIPSGKRVGQYEGPAANLAFSPDSKFLAAALGVVSPSITSPVSEEAGHPERIVNVMEIGRDMPRHVLRLKGPIPQAMAFSPDGRTLATAGRDTSIVLWPVGNEADSKEPRPER